MSGKKKETKVAEFPVLSTDIVLEHVSFTFGQVVSINMRGRIKFNNLPVDPVTWPPVDLQVNTTYDQVEELTLWYKEKFNHALHKVEQVIEENSKEPKKEKENE